jgi:hypothetical protein
LQSLPPTQPIHPPVRRNAASQRIEEPAQQRAANMLLSLAASAALALSAGPAAAEVRLPPLDNDPNRCDRGFVGNTIGQANAVSNKPLDLRFCKYSGANLSGKTLSGGCWWWWGGRQPVQQTFWGMDRASHCALGAMMRRATITVATAPSTH